MPNQKPADKPTAKPSLTPAHWLDKASKRLFGAPIDWSQLSKIAQNNYRLGLLHMENGRLMDAILRLKMVLWFEPQHRDAWYQLGRAQLERGKRQPAIAAFRKTLRIDPKFTEAAYMHAIAAGESTAPELLPRTIPASLAIRHFETLAAGYHHQQLTTYKYQGHLLLAGALKTALGEGRKNLAMLELGVGSGLLGPQIRPLAASLTGVDFSPAMLREAATLVNEYDTPIYDSLKERDMRDALREQPASSLDVIAAAHSLSYVGEIGPLLVDAAAALKPGGILAFTVDKKDEGNDMRFDTQLGRFRYSKPYLTQKLAAAGLSLRSVEPAAIYPEQAMWLVVASK